MYTPKVGDSLRRAGKHKPVYDAEIEFGNIYGKLSGIYCSKLVSV